jgi:membrane-associated protease RseP (regulator of RpoE activity)
LEPQKKNRLRAEVKLPLILIHTPYGLEFFDKVSKSSVARAYAKFNTFLMPVITVLAIFLIIGSLAVIFSNATARQDIRGVGPAANLLIPGLNPYLPIAEGWIALIVTIVIHEAGHGIVARVYNIRVDSTGIVLLLGIPIGAFVNIERDELSRATLSQKAAVLTAGPLNNMILAGLSLFGLFLVISTLSPLPINPAAPQYGVAVVGVNDGSIAQALGITQDSIILSVNGQQVHELQDLSAYLKSNLGKTVQIQWIDKSGHEFSRSAELPSAVEPGKGILGVSVSPLADPKVVLDRYKAAFSQNPLALLLPPTMNQGAVPYSPLMAPKYDSSLGATFVPIANIFFWMWFVNFNVGIFNALPIGPLDGGQLYGSVIESRTKSKTLARNANMLLGVITVGVVLASLFLPYVLF